MTKTEFRALNKAETLEFLLSKFDDPEGDFEEMNADELTQYGIDNWDEAWESEGDEEEAPSDESEAEGDESEAEASSEGEGEEASEDEGDEGESDEAPRNLDLGVIPKERRVAMKQQSAPNTDLA